MKTVIAALLLVLLATQPVRSADPSTPSPSGPVPEETIEFYDDEVDFGDDLPQDAQQAEYLKTIMAMTPRVHNAIRSKAVSPDGRRVVYVVARDAGATTAESLHAFMGVPVGPSEEKQFNEKMLGVRIFAGGRTTTRVRAEWKDDARLVIHSDGEASFLSKEHDGVSILHAFDEQDPGL